MEVGTLECQKKKEDLTDSIGKCCLATGDQRPRLTNCPSAWVAKMFEFLLLLLLFHLELTELLQWKTSSYSDYVGVY